MSIRTITWTVDEDMQVTPSRVQNAGVQGDNNATRVVFSLPAFLQEGYTLTIEYVDSVSGYDKTDPLPVVDGAVGFALPCGWTQHGGEATVRLVADQDGVTAYTAEGRVRYAGRPTALAKIKSLVEESIQAAQDRIAKMIADAKVWIDNVNGVYVGGGEMPAGAVVQIDPTGEATTVEDWLRTEGHALLDVVYPVGSIYLSMNDNNPSVLFGGTWEQLKDRFLLGAGDSYAVGTMGGEKEHTLTVDELPPHNHAYPITSANRTEEATLKANKFGNAYSTEADWVYTDGSGCEGDSHNNMPPYLAVYMWKRVA